MENVINGIEAVQDDAAKSIGKSINAIKNAMKGGFF